jgi:hypothetical protein
MCNSIAAAIKTRRRYVELVMRLDLRHLLLGFDAGRVRKISAVALMRAPPVCAARDKTTESGWFAVIIFSLSMVVKAFRKAFRKAF